MRLPPVLKSALRVSGLAGGLVLLIFGGFTLLIRQPVFGKRDCKAHGRTDPAALRNHVEFLSTEVLPRNTRHPENLNRAAEYIARAFSESGAIVARQDYVAGGVACRNVVARYPGQGSDLLIIGAHYDVFGDLPGADDNASGVAGLLELARLLGEHKLASDVELVAFSTEEPPFFGSSEMGSWVHAQSLPSRPVRVTAMICLEMIGYYSEVQPNQSTVLRLMYPSRGDFVAVVGRWSERKLARDVKKCFRAIEGLAVCSYSGPVIIGVDLSDHRNYWAAGYPAVMITDTAYLRNPNYHTAGDTADSLDYEKMSMVVDGVFNTVLHLAGSE